MEENLNKGNKGKPKIAVIAVHGVADQPAHDSARAIANLLLNHNQTDKQVQYTPFYESTLRIAVRPVIVAQEREPSRKQNPMDERGEYIHKCIKNPQSQPSTEEYSSKTEDILDEKAYGFMRDQLRYYKGEGVRSTYETVRLEGSRLTKDNKPQLDVHIYEMYWADLSRLGTGIVRILGEFYQLLFHLSSLGRDAVDLARIEYQDSFGHKNTWWNWYSETQAWAARMLSGLIPILNLYLLLTAPISLPGNIPAHYLPIVAWSSLAIVGAALIGYLLLWPKQKTPFWLWAIPPVLLALGVIVLGYSLVKGSFSPWLPLGYYRFLAFEWCAISAVIMWLLMSQYTRRRPGADKLSAFIGVFLAGVITELLLSAQDSHEGITDAAFKTVEVLYLALSFSWAVFFILQFAAALLGYVAVWKSTAKRSKAKTPENEERRERAHRVAWTARLTLALPAALFIVVTLGLLTALDRVGSRLLPKQNFYTPQFVLLDRREIPFSGPEFVHQLIITAASPAFIVVLGCILLTILIAGWSLFPVAWAEVSPPKSDDRFSKRFGEWLTKGLNLLHGWSNCFVFLMAVVFPITYAYCNFNSEIAEQFKLTEEILGIFATVLVASTTSILAFRGRLDKVLLGFRSVLDILLDVDNYLRLHPVDNNPRARICARYVSLLRYLCRWKDPQDERGYDALLIVAHSQGTVITADLLRFLKRETQRKADSALERLVSDNRVSNHLPIYFFTMGCPLRQLYGVSFPHLYNWARHYDKSQWEPSNPMSDKQKPDPTQLLGVTRWVNTFRSGDYIGRYLWRSDMCDYQWCKPAAPDKKDTTWSSDRDRPMYVSEDKNLTRREFCLGAGAHTHYWDGISDEVAAEIDILIREAMLKK